MLAGRTAHAVTIPSPIEWFNCRLLLLATAIGKPMDRRHRIQARATGMRKRSPTRSVNDTGAAEGGSNRLDDAAPIALIARDRPDP